MAENVDTSQLEGSLKTISGKFRCITIRKESENNMKRYFGIFCAAVMLFALMAVPMASAESAAQQKEVRRAAALRRSLTSEACAALRRAKELHDALEAGYRPFVDFRALTRFEEKHLEKVFSA